VVGVPGFALLGGHGLARGEFQVIVVERFGDHHLLFVLGFTTAGIIVEKCVGLGKDAVGVVVEMFRAGIPWAMRGLVLAHQEERLVGITLFEPVDGEVGDDVGDIALAFGLLAVVDHGRVVVLALAGKDVPVIEPGRIGDEVPFADHGGLVTC